MLPRLEASDIIREFLAIVQRAPILPRLSRPAQTRFIRAAVETLPPVIRTRLMLDDMGLKPWESMLIRSAGRIAERIRLPGTPPSQACERLGLPENYLYRH